MVRCFSRTLSYSPTPPTSSNTENDRNTTKTDGTYAESHYPTTDVPSSFCTSLLCYMAAVSSRIAKSQRY
uniref:Uncharacterized protein n=1 Tax=Onchocerca volvulus TaxID=6282 RepID=A0A8R1XVX1_ONCVO